MLDSKLFYIIPFILTIITYTLLFKESSLRKKLGIKRTNNWFKPFLLIIISTVILMLISYFFFKDYYNIILEFIIIILNIIWLVSIVIWIMKLRKYKDNYTQHGI
jgi:amino acid transporter